MVSQAAGGARGARVPAGRPGGRPRRDGDPDAGEVRQGKGAGVRRGVHRGVLEAGPVGMEGVQEVGRKTGEKAQKGLF